MSAILLEQEIVHYEVLGRGRPILFLHGWVGSWRYWIPSMQAASTAFRAYALDLWGFGDTAKQSRHYPLEQQVQLVDGFLDQMGIMRIALVGHGLGAVVAMLYALKHPDTVDRVMAVGFPLEEASVSPRLRSATPSELVDWLLTRTPYTEPARLDAPKADPQAIQFSLRTLQAVNLKDTLARMQAPRLLVHGQNDPAILFPRNELLNEIPEQCHQVAFEQSGHFPMLDEGSKFNRLLGDFLNLASGESPRQLQLKEEWKRRVR